MAIDSTLRAIADTDLDCILALNLSEERQTSPLDRQRLLHLLSLASYQNVVTVKGSIAGFLLAMNHQAAYKNDNFAWFKSAYPKFLYVDRIVVGGSYAGSGLGSYLYRDLFCHARSQGLPVVCCEYNIEPPNPMSAVFHDKFGFGEVGRHTVANGTKLVSLQVANA